ncbi:MAG TPA: ornithine cyclodeaminase family protein [Saprospiraceae bacterium]|nr:ornithine cyclodeaminase family protein [Saprospiraceae bacterium]
MAKKPSFAPNMLQPNERDIEEALAYPALIEALRKGFKEDYTVPMRHHHDFKNPKSDQDSTLLLMPAWQAGNMLGLKTVIVSPGNRQFKLPAIHGTYLLFNAITGALLLQCDARTLTKKRTAAASALAADYLARPDSRRLLMLGTGALAPELIKAHRTLRPIEEVWIWGRRYEKAKALAARLRQELDIQISAVRDCATVASKADILSTATLAYKPILFGEWLVPGQHLDLVGSYKPDMREADDEAIQRSKVYVDTLEGAPKESGDLYIPIQKAVLDLSDIQADLFQLCRRQRNGRDTPQEITLFKSVGHALEDLAAAQLLYRHLVK